MRILYLIILVLSSTTLCSFAQDKQALKLVNNMLELIEKGTISIHKQDISLWTPEMVTIQQRNLHRVDSLFNLYGWLKPPVVSKKASRAYFEVLKYAPTDMQKRYQNEVFLAAKDKVLKSGEYYTFADRLLVLENSYQVFGTQIKTDDAGNLYFIPIDTTLINNRKIPVLPPGDYIYFSNPQFTTLFLHIYEKNSKTGVADAQIYLKGEKVGQSNNKGFFQINIPRFKNKIQVQVRKSTASQTIIIDNTKNKDWIDKFIIL